jgi:hypothetical protein
MLDLYAELKAVVQALEERRIDYALCGGLAMAVHGFARATVDIDLFLPGSVEEQVYEAVNPLGFSFPAKPMHFSNIEIRRISKIAGSDVVMLDMLIVNEALADVWETRERYQFNDVAMNVVSREGLIRLKELRNSSQDKADIERLRSEE